MAGTTSPSRMASSGLRLALLVVCALVLAGSSLASPRPSAPAAYKAAEERLHARQADHPDVRGQSRRPTRNFSVLGHTDLGAVDTNGDVWVHGNFAYVGTWSVPCTGLGLKIVDVSDLGHPRLIGKIAARTGTSQRTWSSAA